MKVWGTNDFDQAMHAPFTWDLKVTNIDFNILPTWVKRGIRNCVAKFRDDSMKNQTKFDEPSLATTWRLH